MFYFSTNFPCKSGSNGIDDEDFEPQEFSAKQSDKWEGEDEEDNDVKARILSSNKEFVFFYVEFLGAVTLIINV